MRLLAVPVGTVGEWAGRMVDSGGCLLISDRPKISVLGGGGGGEGGYWSHYPPRAASYNSQNRHANILRSSELYCLSGIMPGNGQ